MDRPGGHSRNPGFPPQCGGPSHPFGVPVPFGYVPLGPGCLPLGKTTSFSMKTKNAPPPPWGYPRPLPPLSIFLLVCLCACVGGNEAERARTKPQEPSVGDRPPSPLSPEFKAYWYGGEA